MVFNTIVSHFKVEDGDVTDKEGKNGREIIHLPMMRPCKIHRDGTQMW